MADLHWGKSEVLQRVGVPLPSSALREDLERLALAASRAGAERILALGDLIHAASGLTALVIEEIAAWRAGVSNLRFDLVRGNHDRRVTLPSEWNLRVHDGGFEEGVFRFRHEPETDTPVNNVSWAGHIHPVAVLRGRYDRVRLPCFVVSERSVLMPAFGSLTGGAEVKARPGERLFMLAGDRVVAAVEPE